MSRSPRAFSFIISPAWQPGLCRPDPRGLGGAMSIASITPNSSIPVAWRRHPSKARAATLLAALLWTAALHPPAAQAADASQKVAALVTIYFHNSHTDVIVSRLLQTMTLDGKGRRPKLTLASLYIDQPQGSQVGIELAKRYHIPVFSNPKDALTLGGKTLAVDGVLL